MDEVKIPMENLQQDSRRQWLEPIWLRAWQWMTGQQSPPTQPDGSTTNPVRRCHKVPEKLGHDVDLKSYYEPSVVSIGPYHHGKAELQQVESLKDTAATLFIRMAGSDNTMEYTVGLVDKFVADIKGVRNWYDLTERGIEEEDFIRMMFLDGCFIIMFISCFISSGFKEMGMTKDTISLVQQDIFKLENQLPFVVLEALCTDRFKISDLFWMLDRYICYCTIGSNRHFQKGIEHEAQPLHLLDLLRKRWVGKENFEDHFSKFNHNFIVERIMTSRLVRNVKELTTSGIFLKPNSSNLLSDIHCSYFLTGNLTLPPMVIDGSTKTIFLNAIAHEACTRNHFGFTSFVCFLDSLIDNADDVKEMRSAGVLQNFLGSDEEVASLFNQIGAVLEPEIDNYTHVKLQIGSYLASKGRTKVATWLAEVIRYRFRNPLTTVAVIVGFLAIFLTAVLFL
uniref:Uncharacterized protein n=1 Tax=Davidia involucrata TaxID=16924 RepID=A0A5B6YPF9_DAVIN